MVHYIALEPQYNFAGISFSRAGLRAEPAVKTTPQFGGVFQDSIFGTQLNVTNHSPREVFINKGTYRGACAAVETFQCRSFSKLFYFINKLGTD